MFKRRHQNNNKLKTKQPEHFDRYGESANLSFPFTNMFCWDEISIKQY